jgi:hypothetical protein
MIKFYNANINMIYVISKLWVIFFLNIFLEGVTGVYENLYECYFQSNSSAKAVLKLGVILPPRP